VQEPALTLVQRAGGRVLMNGMDLEDAKNHLGGAFESWASRCAPRNLNNVVPK